MRSNVTAIVLAYCNESDAAACLDALLLSTYPDLTVLLVDNASPDGSGDRLHRRYPNVPYLQTGANGGYTAGNNRGFEWALARGADFVLVLNDDTAIDSHCVSRLVQTAQETKAAVVAPQIVYFDRPDIVWYAGGSISKTRVLPTHFRENQPVDPADTRRPITFVCGCCFLIRADVLREVGGFDERFFAYVEDLELSLRITRAGHAMVYEPTALVLHRVGRAAPATPFQIRLRDMNRRRVVARHYRTLERLRFAAWFYPTRLVHLARYIARGAWAEARATISGAFGALEA